MNPIKILLADDHELIRVGLRSRLEPRQGWLICAETDNGRDAIKLAQHHKPEIAVLDIGMANLNGIDATRQILKVSPHTSVLILTMQDSDSLIREALTAGARGFLLKTDATRLLVTAIETLLVNQPYFTPRVSETLLGDFLSPQLIAAGGSGGGDPLTGREREIVQLLAEAHSSKEIAVRLGVSLKTIEAHRANVMRKLHLHSIAELVRYAIRNNITTP